MPTNERLYELGKRDGRLGRNFPAGTPHAYQVGYYDGSHGIERVNPYLGE